MFADSSNQINGSYVYSVHWWPLHHPDERVVPIPKLSGVGTDTIYVYSQLIMN